MLRRKAGNIVEFRQLEAMLTQSSPPGLTAARREALWLRISSGLGEHQVWRCRLEGIKCKWSQPCSRDSGIRPQ